MKEIQLTQGKVSLVDDEDFEYLNQFKWYAYKDKNTFYVRRNIRVNSKQTALLMHCVIFNGKMIDHKDGNGLNNQKRNLRFCTNQQNCMNTKSHKNSTSKFKGVYWNKLQNKWAAKVCFNKKNIHLGVYKIEIEAAKAYDKKAIELFGEFAKLNIYIN